MFMKQIELNMLSGFTSVLNTKRMLKKLPVLLLLMGALLMGAKSWGTAAVTQSNFTGVVVPQYMASGTSTRLPVFFRATVSGLTASTSYRFYVQGTISSDFAGTNSGAGNSQLINSTGTTFTYTASPSMSNAGTYETFTTDASGNYTGWFGFMNTGNSRYTAGNTVYPCITINGGGSSTTVTYRLALDKGITVLAFSTSSGATNGTFIQCVSSSATAKNMVALYDNVSGTGSPLFITCIESVGASGPASDGSQISGYSTGAGAWNAMIPNTLANGVRRIEQRSVSTGAITGCTATDADGTWSSGVNTVNPRGGNTAKVLTSTDAPLSATPAIPTASNTSVTYDGSTHYSSASTTSGNTVDFYDAATNGNILVTGTTTTTNTPAQTAAGTYTYYAEARNTTTGCVSLSRQTVTLTISKAAITITGTRVYDATTVFAGSSLTANGVNGESFALTGSGTTSSANVQTSQQLSSLNTLALGTPNGGALTSNYNAISATNSSISITAKALTVSGITVGSQTYNGTTTATLGGTAAFQGTEAAGAGTTVDGKPYSVDAVSAGGTAIGTMAARNVGSEAVTITGVTVSGTGNGNYTVTQQTGLSATVTAKALTVSGITAGSQVYNGTTTATLGGTAVFQGTESAGAGTTVDGKPYSVDAVSAGGTAVGTMAAKDVGSEAVTITGVTVTGTGNGNYTVTQQTGLTATVTAKALTAIGTLIFPSSKIYDGTTATATSGSAALQGTETAGAGTTADGKPYSVDGVSLTGTAAYNYNFATVASGTTITETGLTLNGTGNSNYTLTAPTFSATITKKALTANSTVTKVYDGITLAGTVTVGTITGLQNGETLGITGTATSYSAAAVANNYSVTISYSLTDGTGSASNYSMANLGITNARITAAGVTITPTASQSKVYGGADPTFTYSSSVSGLTFTGALSRATGENVNTYAYTLGTLSAGNNFSLTLNGSNTFAITKATLTITANNQGVCYGTLATTVTGAGSYSVSGYQNGEGSSVISGTVTYTSPYTATSTGTAAITPVITGLTATNYTFSPVDGIITIYSLPTTFNVTAAGSPTAATFCSGGSGVDLALSNSTSGVSYQLLLNGSNSGSSVSGTGSALDFGNKTSAGTYTVLATNITTTCVATMNNSPVVSINTLPSISSVSGTQTTCNGGTPGNLTVSASGTALTYQWYSNTTNSNTNGTSVGSGSGGQTATYTPPTSTSGIQYYYVVVSGTCPSPVTSSVLTVTIANTWLGTTSAWSTGSNWSCGSAPGSTDYVIIPSGTPHSPTFSGDVTVNDLNDNNIIYLNGHTLTVNGTISGSTTFSGTLASSLIIGPGATGTLTFDATTDSVTNGLNNLTINGGSVTLSNALHIYGILNVSSGSLDLASKHLTLHSNASGTASVAAVNDGTHGTLSNASNVSVQRYHIDHRAWLLMSAPLTTSGAASGLIGDIHSNWQAYTYITGPSTPVYGLDAGTNTSYGIKYWTGSAWANGFSSSTTSTTSTANTLFGGAGGTTADNKPFSLFVRGDRSALPSTAGSHSTATLVATGALQTGTKYYGLGAGTYSLVANPYAAPIDLDAFLTDNSALTPAAVNGVYTTTFYYWDANLSTTGGYTTAYYSSVAGWQFPSQNTGVNTTPRYIQSGQAFFVTTNGQTSVTFNESQKSTSNSSNGVFGNNTTGTVNIGLSKGSPLSSIDGVILLYNNRFSAAVIQPEDAVKFWGNEENIGIVRNGSYLSLEARPVPGLTDTTFLYMSNLVAGTSTYNFTITGTNMPANATGYLVDNYLGTQTPLNLASVTNINFAVTSVAGSKASNRFMIVFTNTNPLSVDGMQIKASVKGKSAKVDWKVVTEKNVDHYEVERSNNAVSFVSITSQSANNVNNSGYTYTDNQAAGGAEYYRIKAISKDGTIQYSSVAKVYIGDIKEGINIYPNPVAGNVFTLQMNNIAKGTYHVNIINTAGQIVESNMINHEAGSSTENVAIKTLASGVYTVSVSRDAVSYQTEMIVK